jgi:hypothetical protein
MRRSANRWGYLLQQGALPLRGGIFRHDGDVNSYKAVNSMAAAIWGVVE